MKNFEIQSFNVDSASKEEWSNYHKYRRKRLSEIFPDDPIEDDAVAEERIKLARVDDNIKAYAVIMKESPGEIVAWLEMHTVRDSSPSFAGNEHVLRVRSMAVLKEHRRKGIGTALLRLVHEYSKEKGKQTIIAGTAEEEGREINRKIGGQEALELRDNRLDIDTVDWDMVKRWEKEGVERSPDTSLEFYTSIPDELIEDFCKKYTEISNQAPLDDLDVGDTIFTPEVWRKYEETSNNAGATWLKAVLREKNGEVSGLSDVVYISSKAPLLTQNLTGVHQNYRGQGKGKWVKAAMLLKIREEFPDIKTVYTGNASSNAPMLSINERLGFKLHHEIYNMQVEVKQLGEYLEKL